MPVEVHHAAWLLLLLLPPLPLPLALLLPLPPPPLLALPLLLPGLPGAAAVPAMEEERREGRGRRPGEVLRGIGGLVGSVAQGSTASSGRAGA
jgi:hypothetical protein